MHQHCHNIDWQLHTIRLEVRYVHLLAPFLVGLELSQKVLTAVLLEDLKVVIWHPNRFWASIDYLARYVPFLGRSYQNFDTLAYKGFSRLASKTCFILLQHHLGVSLSMALQLRWFLVHAFCFALCSVIKAHDPD